MKHIRPNSRPAVASPWIVNAVLFEGCGLTKCYRIEFENSVLTASTTRKE